MELALTMPEIKHHQGEKFLAKLKKSAKLRSQKTGTDGMHPCTTSHVAYMMCMRRHPDTFLKKCDTQAVKHAECIQSNQDWEPESSFEHVQFLEHLRVFAECRKFKKLDPQEIMRDGMAGVLDFVKKD